MAYTTINKSSEHFTVTTWTGDSTTPKTFTTGTFKPDWLWGKNRSKTYNHQVYDTTRGAGNNKELETSTTGAEGASNPETYGYVSAFTSTGFTATRGTDGTGDDYWNESPDKYVAWSWKANGGTTSSNSDGAITSTVQANTTAGFSIITYTGTGSAATIGHGLGAVPGWIFVKRLNATSNWRVFHKSLGATKNLILDESGSAQTQSAVWNDTEPTSSVFSVGTGTDVNASGGTYVAYCFAEKAGYSKFGTYTGNGDVDGPMIYSGFKPAWGIFKRTNSTGNWIMMDNKRSPFNEMQKNLFANTNAAEDSSTSYNDFDFLSNGVKIREDNNDINASGSTYIYMLFAENPIVGTNNVPATAR